MSNGETPLESYFKKQPQKTFRGIAIPGNETKAIQPAVRYESGAPSPEAKKITFTTISDQYYSNQGKLFDYNRGEFRDAASFQKQLAGGVAGVGYNILMTANVGSISAQVALKGTGIALGTTSLALGSDMSVVKAFGVSALTFAFKPSNLGYGWMNWAKSLQNVIPTSNIFSKFANDAVGIYQTWGQKLYGVYHHGKMVNPWNILGKGHSIGFNVIPWQQVEANLTKKAAKGTIYTFISKESYEPYNTGQSALNQLYLENNPYPFSLKTPTTGLNYAAAAKPPSVFTQLPPKDSKIIDTVDPFPNKKQFKFPDKETEYKEKLEGFVTVFDSRKPANVWYELLDRILRPALYASYDKAKSTLRDLKNKNKVAYDAGALVATIVAGGWIDAIENLSTGYAGASKLSNGIDYNDEVVTKLAKYKYDVESAGGKFVIQPNGTFYVTAPPGSQKETRTAAQLQTVLEFRGPALSGEDDYMGAKAKMAKGQQAVMRNVNASKNVTAIRQLVSEANRSAWREAYNKFRTENKELVKGKWHAAVLPLFYTANPKYAPKEFNRQRGLRSGDAERSKIFQGADLKR
jgi:hypothetical protein